ncbi:unnamed protein product, partial [Amoebophrya sp. A25]
DVHLVSQTRLPQDDTGPAASGRQEDRRKQSEAMGNEAKMGNLLVLYLMAFGHQLLTVLPSLYPRLPLFETGTASVYQNTQQKQEAKADDATSGVGILA